MSRAALDRAKSLKSNDKTREKLSAPPGRLLELRGERRQKSLFARSSTVKDFHHPLPAGLCSFEIERQNAE